MKMFKFKPNLPSFLTLSSFKSSQNQAMSNPNSPTIDEVIENFVEEILRERAKPKNQENATAEEFRQEAEEIEVEGEA